MAEPSIEVDPPSEDPPLLAFVRSYWDECRRGRPMPSRRDIVPSDLRSHLPHILLVDVIGDGADFRYRLLGTQLHDYFAGNPTGQLMSDILAPFGSLTVARTLDTYRSVVARRAPLRVRGSGSYFAQGPKTFDAMLAPLSDDGIEANMIFGTFLFTWDGNVERAPTRHADPGEAGLARALTGR